MDRMIRTLLPGIILVAGLAAAQAQTPSDSAAAPKPSPAAERARLRFLAGSFATATYLPPPPSKPKGVSGTGTSVMAWTLDSMFLSIEDQSFDSLLGHYRAHGMLGYDAPARQFALSMFNNFGDHPSYHGNFVGDTLVLQARLPSLRGDFDQKIVWYKDGETIKLKIANDYGKGFVPVFEQTSTPVAQPTK